MPLFFFILLSFGPYQMMHQSGITHSAFASSNTDKKKIDIRERLNIPKILTNIQKRLNIPKMLIRARIASANTKNEIPNNSHLTPSESCENHQPSCYSESQIESLANLSIRALEAKSPCYRISYPISYNYTDEEMQNESIPFDLWLNERIHQQLDYNRPHLSIKHDECGFNTLIQQAKTENEYKILSCKKSPWKDLNLSERVRTILELSTPHAKKYDVDPESMLCIAGRETTTLEPLAIDITYWTKRKKQSPPYRGLGQIIKRQTFDWYFFNGGESNKKCQHINGSRQKLCIPYVKKNGKVIQESFISNIPPFNDPPYTILEGRELLYDALAVSPDLQLELMAYTLSNKAYGHLHGGNKKCTMSWKNLKDNESMRHIHSYSRIFMDYNGNDTKDPRTKKPIKEVYAKSVNKCRRCLLEKKNINKKNRNKEKYGLYPYYSEDMVDCLDHVMPLGTTVRKQFNIYRRRYCEDKDIQIDNL